MNSEQKKDYYENTYMPKMHRYGKLIGALGVLLSFIPPIVLAVVFKALPDWSKLPAAFLTGAAAFGFLWIMEPIGYFNVLGPVGTYMAFLSGNISNMRVPCASMAQVSAEVEPGTEEGSLIATIGMAVSVIINVTILTIGVILGTVVLSKLPPSIVGALNYLLPALFGALLMQFGIKDVKYAIGMLVYCCLLYVLIYLGVFSWLPSASNWLPIITAVFFGIAFKLWSSSRAEKAAKAAESGPDKQ